MHMCIEVHILFKKGGSFADTNTVLSLNEHVPLLEESYVVLP
jgi:hypothetical protein